MPPGGGVLKAEGVGLVAGLGVFKQQPPGVKGEAGTTTPSKPSRSSSSRSRVVRSTVTRRLVVVIRSRSSFSMYS